MADETKDMSARPGGAADRATDDQPAQKRGARTADTAGSRLRGTKKDGEFLRQPLSSELTSIPGVGPATKAALEEAGITSTFKLVARFFDLEKDQDAFAELLLSHGVQAHLAKDIAGALDDKATLGFL